MQLFEGDSSFFGRSRDLLAVGGCALMMAGLAAVMAVISPLLPSPVLAQTEGAAQTDDAAPNNPSDSSNDNEQIAKELFEAGRAAYDAGRFEDALRDFQDAYARSPRPKLLFNIGQSADRLRMDEMALSFLRKYLAEAGDADNRAAVENRVRVLEQVTAEQKSTQRSEAQGDAELDVEKPALQVPVQVEVEPTNASPSEASPGLPFGPIILGGAGLALIGAGAVFGLLESAAESDYARASVTTLDEAKAARALLDDAKTKALVTNILFVTGGVSLAATAVWYLLDSDENKDHQTKQLSVAPLWSGGAYGVQVSGLLGGAL